MAHGTMATVNMAKVKQSIKGFAMAAHVYIATLAFCSWLGRVVILGRKRTSIFLRIFSTELSFLKCYKIFMDEIYENFKGCGFFKYGTYKGLENTVLKINFKDLRYKKTRSVFFKLIIFEGF